MSYDKRGIEVVSNSDSYSESSREMHIGYWWGSQKEGDH
jgi:hypothetical protein